MSKIECPACAGPDNAGCLTCEGTSEVTREVFDAFILTKVKQDEMFEFWNRVQSHMYQEGTFRFEANGEVFELNATE